MTWRDHAGSFAVAIDIANVHLGLWTSSNSSVASSLMEDHQTAVQVAVLCMRGWGSCKVRGWASRIRNSAQNIKIKNYCNNIIDHYT